MDNSRASNQGFEENTMAILDPSGIKDSRDLHDDRVSFLEAVRSTCLASAPPSPPSWNMFDATFRILRDSQSLELAMASYQLLIELDKQYPTIYQENSGKGAQLVVSKEAWSPFAFGPDGARGEEQGAAKNSDHLFDALKFSNLVEDIARAVNSTDFELGVKHVENLLLFQYLISVVEADFIPRYTLYKESLNWVLFRESMLNVLLGSRKLHFISLVRNCMSIILKQCHHKVSDSLQDLKTEKEACTKSAYDSTDSLAIAVCELERSTFSALRKSMILVMELDSFRKDADLLGITSRTDSFRSPVLEIIVNELAYNLDHISPFLMAFSEPKWKLEIILQYFSKYCNKSSVRTRRSNGMSNDLTLENILNGLSTSVGVKGMAKKISLEVIQLLLAHAYQACFSLLHDLKNDDDSTIRIGCTLMQISSSFISAFQNLKENYEYVEITPLQREALFVAATVAGKIGN